MANYRWLMDSMADRGHFATSEGDDWNVTQIALLCLFRYHQTGDEKCLEDARRVADFLIDNRLHERGGNWHVGDDRRMDLRECGDFIAMLTCLSDPSLPVMSSRYFLFPVGLRSPSFPVFGEARVDAYRPGGDGSIHARVKGGAGQTEDVWVMVMSREVASVLVNGGRAAFETKKVAGHGYVVIREVDLGDAVIEIR